MMNKSMARFASAPAHGATAAPRMLFAYGFRPFFLLAGLFAVLAVPAWLLMYSAGVQPLPDMPPQYWHAHEMVFGFLTAAIAGFLLTAVPSWTGARGFAGLPLVLLSAAWLLGRLAFAMAGTLPAWAVAALDMIFLPALALVLAPPLVRAKNRNTPMLAVLAALWLADGIFLVALFRQDPLLASRVLRVAIDIVLTLVTVIGGRIVPSFTANALRRRGEEVRITSRKWLETLIVPTMVAVILVGAWRPDSTLSGILAAIAAVAHALRLSGWGGFRTRNDAILWVLHVAYAWLPIGFALKAFWLLNGSDWAVHWLHAHAVGALGTMILGVMTRVALGHTGRELHVKPSIAVAYVLLSLGALVRVFAPSIVPTAYLPMLTISGALWTAAFVLFLVVYAPILTSPRVDGKPG